MKACLLLLSLIALFRWPSSVLGTGVGTISSNVERRLPSKTPSSDCMFRIRGGASVFSSSCSQQQQQQQQPPVLARHQRRRRHENRLPLKVRGGGILGMIRNGGTSRETHTSIESIPKIGILQVTTFLFVFASSMTSLSHAPVFIQELGATKATTLLSVITGCGALAEVAFSSQVGSLLDAYGRKPALVLATTAVAVANAAVAMRGSVSALCVSKFISLLSFSVYVLASQAFVSDLSNRLQTENPERWLSSILGVNMALSGLGFLLGIMTAGYLSSAKSGGLAVIFTASSVVTVLASLLSGALLPETLPRHERRSPSSRVDGRERLRQLLLAPLSSTKLLFRHGSQVRTLAVLLMLTSLPMNQGDMFQVYSKQEWKMDTKSFSNFLALYGLVGILANGCGSFLIKRIGTKHFTLLAICSRLVSTAGTVFFGYEGAVVGILVGFLGAAQSIGILAALVAAGTKSGLPQGELAGERSSLMALLKVVGPIWYSFLYIEGSSVMGTPNLPFLFNILVCAVSLAVTQFNL